MSIRGSIKQRAQSICIFIGMCSLCCGMAGLLTRQALCEEVGMPDPQYVQAVNQERCLICHGDPSDPAFIDPAKFQRSIHRGHLCTSCHSDITQDPHDIPVQPVDCAACHRIETEIYLNSDHGIALKSETFEAASCQACHGDPHELLDYRDYESPVFRSNIPETCAHCHDKTEEMTRFSLSQPAPVESYRKNVHGLALMEEGAVFAAVCTDCHGSHNLNRAANPASKLYWQNIPATCGKCHENIFQTFLRSVHGKAVTTAKQDAPVCTDCHGEHSIDAVNLATSTVFSMRILETCGQCHGAERITTKYRLPPYVIQTYMDSFHGLAIQSGSVTTAHCASCHGKHDILPSNDPRSSIHPDNLAKTCGKCHAGMGAQVAKGQIHSGLRPGREHRIVSFIRYVYLILIAIVISVMLVHYGIDFLRKFRMHYRQTGRVGKPGRMELSVRIQYALLLVTFAILAYTGFAYQFPNAWWVIPFVEGRAEWRSLIHRSAGVVFCLLAIYHVWSVLCTKHGRRELKTLLPRRDDFRQFFQMVRYLAGERGERPVLSRYSYVAKAEYWALVGGFTIMIVTGLLMFWEEWFLRFFPQWFFDVIMTIHFFEAILMCLAILVYGYFMIVDPDVYPMKWTWITGDDLPSDTERQEGEVPPDKRRDNP